jgi:hypothetical protein
MTSYEIGINQEIGGDFPGEAIGISDARQIRIAP